MSTKKIHPLENTEAVYIYKRVRAGMLDNYPVTFFAKEWRKQRFRYIIKYVLEIELNITPEQALATFGKLEMKKYHFQHFLQFVEDFPERTERRAFIRLLRMAYPNLQEESFEELTIWMYQEVLDGKRKKFPTNYFEGFDGERRAEICFQYGCEHVLKLEKREIPKIMTREILSQLKLRILLTLIYDSIFDLVTSVYPEFDSESFQ